MGSPYTSVTVNSYNANPPTDDGAATSNNQIEWKKFKEKIGDPLKTAIAAINQNVGAAFAKQVAQGATTGVATDATLTAAAQGQSFVFTDAGKILTLPDATVIGSPFSLSVANNGTGNNVIAAAVTAPVQKINAATSITLCPGQGGLITCDGSNFFYFGSVAGSGLDKGTKQMFFQTAAPLGYTKDTSLDDAGIKLTSGTVGADAGTIAFSSVFGSQLTIAKSHLPNYQLTFDLALGGSPVSNVTINQNATGGSGAFKVVSLNVFFMSGAVGGTINLDGGGQPLADLRLKYAQAIRAIKN
jgi:hypothetical protein